MWFLIFKFFFFYGKYYLLHNDMKENPLFLASLYELSCLSQKLKRFACLKFLAAKLKSKDTFQKFTATTLML